MQVTASAVLVGAKYAALLVLQIHIVYAGNGG